jgi:thioredoxin 1
MDVADSDFDSVVMRSTQPVMIEFFSPNCGHCSKMAKVVDALEDELAGSVKVVRMNILENTVVPARFGVTGIPAFFLIHNGEVAAKTLGAMPKGRLKSDLGL